MRCKEIVTRRRTPVRVYPPSILPNRHAEPMLKADRNLYARSLLLAVHLVSSDGLQLSTREPTLFGHDKVRDEGEDGDGAEQDGSPVEGVGGDGEVVRRDQDGEEEHCNRRNVSVCNESDETARNARFQKMAM